jgi:hypothetical protein
MASDHEFLRNKCVVVDECWRYSDQPSWVVDFAKATSYTSGGVLDEIILP